MPYSLQAFATESLLTSAKMTQMMDNDEQLKASVVGSQSGGYTWANSGHTHNGSNSALIESLGSQTVAQANIDASAVGQAELKTTTGEVTETAGNFSYATLPGGSYGFYPQVKLVGLAEGGSWFLVNSYGGPGTSYTTLICLRLEGTVGGGRAANAQQRYIQASPPYKIGKTIWGHFIFTLRNKLTGDILSGWQAEDPPWAYNGIGIKDSPERIASCPQPFWNYYNKELPDDLEISLYNLKNIDVKTWREELEIKGESILDPCNLQRLKVTGVQTFSNFNLPSNIFGFSDKVIIREVQWR